MSTESIHRQTVDEHGFFRLIVSLPVHGRSQSWSLTVIRTVGETKESPPGYPRLGDMCESGARPCKIRQNQVNSSGAPGTQRRRRDRLGDMTDGKPMPMPIRTLLSDECQEMGDGREAELFSTRPVLDQDMMVLPGRHYSALPPGKPVLDMMPSSLSSLQGRVALASWYLKRSDGYGICRVDMFAK